MTLTITSVGKRFGGFVALDDVSLEIPGGELVALLGPSGSGKTTLLRILAGLEAPDVGAVRDDGADLVGQTARARNVGLVFQHYALFRHLTVYENIAFALRVRKRPKREIDARVRELIGLIQLEGLERRMPAQLSGGQRQRVALARALAAAPRLLLLDEPFGALDAQVRTELRRWLRRLHDELHVTTVFVTHDQEEAFEVADRVVIMNRGRIEQVGRPGEIFDHPASDFVVRFLGPVTYLPPGVGGDRAYVRPHDLELVRAPGPADLVGTVVRVTPLGATARVEVAVAEVDGPIYAAVERRQLAALGLAAGDRVGLSLRHARALPSTAPVAA
ncbi:MAG: TOBE-like domain-containing protein [Myxococcales bacterium]|nr:TOBE-like domain-containing protein [Myxococcales bacterium]